MAACNAGADQANTPEVVNGNQPAPTEEGPSATSTSKPPFASDSLSTGDVAPDFILPDSNGNMVRLADQLLDNRLVILVFYHAYN